MRCASISATVCSTRAGSRPSVKQAATRSSKRILRLVRRNSRPPPSLLIQAPSNWATTRREKWWANAKLSWLHSVMRKAVSFSGIDFVSTPQLCLKTRPFSTVNYSWLFTTGEKSGLEVSLRHLLQDLLLQRQLGHQSTQTTVLFLQLFQPSRLFQLQSAVLFSPAVVGLLGDPGFFAGLCEGFLVGHFDFDLPQDRDDLFCTVLLPCHASAPLVPVSLTFALVQNSPVTSTSIVLNL